MESRESRETQVLLLYIVCIYFKGDHTQLLGGGGVDNRDAPRSARGSVVVVK